MPRRRAALLGLILTPLTISGAAGQRPDAPEPVVFHNVSKASGLDVSQRREARAEAAAAGEHRRRQIPQCEPAVGPGLCQGKGPSGRTEVVQDVAANQLAVIREGMGIVAEKPFER